MAEKTLEQRISALEAQLANKTLEQHFRGQAELIDKLFVYRFEELEKTSDAKHDRQSSELQDRVESRFEKADSRLESVQRDVAVIKHAVKAILTRLP